VLDAQPRSRRGGAETADALQRAFGEAHKQYTFEVNKREGWTGFLWQGRFASFVMDDRHTLAAIRYVELNPVRAGLVTRRKTIRGAARARTCSAETMRSCERSRYSRASRLGGFSFDRCPTFAKSGTTSPPLAAGTDGFIEQMERELGRNLRPGRGGRPRN